MKADLMLVLVAACRSTIAHLTVRDRLTPCQPKGLTAQALFATLDRAALRRGEYRHVVRGDDAAARLIYAPVSPLRDKHVGMAFDPGNRLIAAIDVPERREAEALVARLGGVPSWIKIGLELFCAAGPDVVSGFAARHRVMLDLKLHDIPETVARAAGRVAALGAGLLTVHAGGGRAMLEAAVRAAGETKILAVTVLTSLDAGDLADIGAVGPVEQLVVLRARLALDAGCAGVVASPWEAVLIREAVPHDFLIVTPGIRPAGSDAGDQKRVMTPKRARVAGADLIVVGRPLRDAADPAEAARAIVAELS